jgi:hypothetical protein
MAEGNHRLGAAIRSDTSDTVFMGFTRPQAAASCSLTAFVL